jgi:hypothetical protein
MMTFTEVASVPSGPLVRLEPRETLGIADERVGALRRSLAP